MVDVELLLRQTLITSKHPAFISSHIPEQATRRFPAVITTESSNVIYVREFTNTRWGAWRHINTSA